MLSWFKYDHLITLNTKGLKLNSSKFRYYKYRFAEAYFKINFPHPTYQQASMITQKNKAETILDRL